MKQRFSSDQRKAQIIAESLAHIGERGCRSFTPLAIAKRIGISEAAVFRHFATKQVLIVAVLDHVHKKIEHSASRIKQDDPWLQIESLLKILAFLLFEQPGVWKVIFSDQITTHGGSKAILLQKEIHSFLLHYIKIAIEKLAQSNTLTISDGGDCLPIIIFGAIHSTAIQFRYIKTKRARVLFLTNVINTLKTLLLKQ